MIFGRDFRIVKQLRQGGMGAVYLADQLSTGKQRALKVMAPDLAMDPATRERFVLEASVTSAWDEASFATSGRSSIVCPTGSAM